MAVFVLDKHKKPLMPCSEKRARLLLTRKKAVVHRKAPFTIRIKDRIGGAVQPVSLKLDPGSRTTGIALVRESEEGTNALFLAELEHRGEAIRKRLEGRRNYRRRRRSANLRYRAPRFLNRRKPKGWLAPSLNHRVLTTMSWIKRFRRVCPINAVAMELVRFDLQKQENPEINGVEYQQGELVGYEIREYLLEKWGRVCVYCSKEDVPLEIEHILAKSNGGSNRVSNLTLACRNCNQRKGSKRIEVFLAKKPNILERILRQAKRPLKDAAAVNSTRWALFEALKATGLSVETGSGGRTKWNRCRMGIPKAHALDALCVGRVKALFDWKQPSLVILCTGRGAYQRTRVTAAGFPRGYLMRQKSVFGFRTGDLVRANVSKGKKKGIHVGRVAIRESGSFNIQTANGLFQGISFKYCCLLQRNDGYQYLNAGLLPALKDGVSAPKTR